MTNDNFIDAIVLTGEEVTTTGTNVGFTGEAGEPSQQGELNSAWWSWTAPFSGEVQIDTNGSNYDTFLSVFTGNAVDDLTVLTQNDDGGNGLQSRVNFNAQAGTTYQIAVDGFSSSQGNINLNLAKLEQQNTQLFTPAGDGGLRVTLDPFGAFGSSTAGANAFYDPVGGIGSSGTTFESGVAIRFGDTGGRSFLSVGDIGGSGNLRSPGFTTVSNTSAESSFSFEELDFELTQTVDALLTEGERTGSFLNQTYTITNPGDEAVTFELVRYIDGDLVFDGSFSDGGGRLIKDGREILFETDQAGEPETSTTFIGITAEGGITDGPGRYEIDSFSGLGSRIVNGTALDDTVTGDGADPDEFVDPGSAYDITMALRNSFVLDPGESTSYTNLTLFGQGKPVEVVLPPIEMNNAAPDALDEVGITNLDTVISIDVLGNDSDPDGDPLSVSSFDTTGTLGTVTDNGDGTFSYDPNGQFNLNIGEKVTDSFTYTITDGNGGTDTATVNVTVFNGIIIEGDNEPAFETEGNRIEEGVLVLGDNNEADLGNGDDITIIDGDGNVIDAGLGDDQTTVEGNNNTINTDIGSDIVEVEGESNTIETGSGTDDIDITGDNNTVEAGSGNDDIDIVGDGTTLDAGNGDDNINLTGDASTVDAGSGDDVVVITGDNNDIDGGRGDDDITGTGQNLIVDGGDGNDLIVINTDNGTLGAVVEGGKGDDMITGSQADDILLGNQDDDVIDGRDGDDIIEGNKGTDNLTGGAGADIFRFGTDAADGFTNLIVDFEQGVDLLAIEDLDLNEFTTADGGTTYDFSIGRKTLTIGFTNPVTLMNTDFTNYDDTFV